MDYFPVFMNLRDQDVLVVGGGAVAERKIRLLLKAGANVGLVARELSDNLRKWRDDGVVRHIAVNYDSTQLKGQRLAYAATDDRGLNRQVFQDAEASGVPVNVVDDADHCRFISPAVVDRSPVQVAIVTGGASPVLTRLIRGRIERLLPTGLGRVALALKATRAEAKARLTVDARRYFFESLLSWDWLQRWSTHGVSKIKAEVRNKLKRAGAGKPGGMVYLVGAGPGSPDLLTLRAVDVLGSADVILHDRLVSDAVLDMARRDADRIYVGKEAGVHHRSQEEIHRIMLAEAAKGRTVVRLKGGDAFIFGRGGEEMQVLRNAGVPYEVVPGVTAATGCAAFAGIPLTHREHAQSVTFVTGHLANGNQPVEWKQIAGKGKTVVVYMGVKQGRSIRAGLLHAGVAPELPVALIEDGSCPSQRVMNGTVDTIPTLVAGARRGRPGLLVIGEVAALASTLGWFRQNQVIRHVA